jgi:hypothetical protein
MKRLNNNIEVVVAQVSPDYARSKIPGVATDIGGQIASGGGPGVVIPLFTKNLHEMISGGKKTLAELIRQHMPWLPHDIENLQLPTWYYLEHHQFKVAPGPNGIDVYYFILKRESDKKQGDKFTIFDITNREIRIIDQNDPLFTKAKDIHVEAEKIKMATLNRIIRSHNNFMDGLEEAGRSGGIRAWCPMVFAALKLAEDRKTQLKAQLAAAEARKGSTGAELRVQLQEDFSQGVEAAFADALKNKSMFSTFENIIVHFLSKFAGKEDLLAAQVRARQINLSNLVSNLIQNGDDELDAQNKVDGMLSFLADVADKIVQERQRKRDRTPTPKDPVDVETLRKQVPTKIEELNIEDMPAFVHSRLQGYSHMRNYESQGKAMVAEINREQMTDIDDVITHMQSIIDIVCKNPSFPARLKEISKTPLAVQTLKAAKDRLLDFFKKYNSEMFVIDKENKDLRINKTRIGGGRDSTALGNLQLCIYLVKVYDKLEKMGI